jgi:transposase
MLVNDSMNRHQYVKIIKEYLLPLMKSVEDNFGSKMVFMQDNILCHKIKTVLQFLKANEVETLSWLPQSPDLNPIENLWSIIKAKRQKKYRLLRTKKELIEQIFDI